MSAVRKPITRRARDRSQLVRQSFQVSFLLLNLWIGAQFYRWVRFYETGGATARVSRPPGVEGWLPIASLMNLKYWLVTGAAPEVHAAGLFLLIAFLAMSILLRKSFCSWFCPILPVDRLITVKSAECHGVPAVCRGLPGQGRAGSEDRAARRHSRVGGRCRRRSALPARGRLCALDRTLAHDPARYAPLRSHPARERVRTSGDVTGGWRRAAGGWRPEEPVRHERRLAQPGVKWGVSSA